MAVHKKKVLIADDDDAIGTLLRAFLTTEGYYVTIVHDGTQTLEALKREGGWVILLDLMMPKIDGLEVLRQLRHDPTLLDGNLVIVMSASWRLSSAVQEWSDQVVAEVLPKPFDLDHVLALVSRLAARIP
jgi:DNA-binding response OmpR family regulator